MSLNSTSELAGPIVGATIQAIYVSEEYLTFETDRGLVTYTVEGDCCSHSYFFDIHGVDHLLNNGAVTAFEEVTLSRGDVGYRPSTWEEGVGTVDYSEIAVYGYRITTEHPTFGPVSSVFSFRNSSNGYYGGWMYLTEGRINLPSQVRVYADVLDVEKLSQNVIVGEIAAREIEPTS